jgi:hypothetical protein
MRTFTCNTNRKYTAEGQVITVAVTEDGEVLFADHSRAVTGNCGKPLFAELIATDYELKDWVMRHYDQHSYRYDPRATQLRRVESNPERKR